MSESDDKKDKPLDPFDPEDIAHTGDWGKLQENRAKLAPVSGRHDVYLVLTNPKKGGGLMNIDWVQFDR